jgi:hypothetical protein
MYFLLKQGYEQRGGCGLQVSGWLAITRNLAQVRQFIAKTCPGGASGKVWSQQASQLLPARRSLLFDIDIGKQGARLVRVKLLSRVSIQSCFERPQKADEEVRLVYFELGHTHMVGWDEHCAEAYFSIY